MKARNAHETVEFELARAEKCRGRTLRQLLHPDIDEAATPTASRPRRWRQVS
ncbi:hypothetical protein [Lentzea pudingi]|uniref:hypothetical protein n=1 Tax=Lentzea pudingi TaxID=1789439 RepID=UPI0016650CE9|nr:hypothetical protein [Lentzea pudingi]